LFYNKPLGRSKKTGGIEIELDTSAPGDNINIIQKKTETLIDHSKEAGLEVNKEKIKYVYVVSSTESREKS
jgi:hypothetical protein